MEQWCSKKWQWFELNGQTDGMSGTDLNKTIQYKREPCM